MRGSLDKPRNKQAHIKKAREAEALACLEGQTPPDHGSQQDDANIDAYFLSSVPSLDKAKSNSTKTNLERLKPKPSRVGVKSNETQLRVVENGGKGNSSMDAMSIPDMLRFLETEEALLTQLQSKMSAELSRLQVEEHVFLHTLKILSQKHASTNKLQDQLETSSEDQDFIDALNEALVENEESVPSSEDKGEGMSVKVCLTSEDLN